MPERDQENINLGHWTISFTPMQGCWNLVGVSTLLACRKKDISVRRFCLQSTD